jgi:hypothetical protein
MSISKDPIERLRAQNPVPGPIEPDWQQIRGRIDADGSRATEVARPNRLPRLRRWRPGPRGSILGGMLCVVAASGVLLALAPWNSVSPSSFLAKAAAALAPQPGDVLYESWERIVAPEPGNRFRLHGASFGPEQIWIDGVSPHRYRTVLRPASNLPPRSEQGGALLAQAYGVTVGCSCGAPSIHGASEMLDGLARLLSRKPLEIGGTLQAPSRKPLRGVPPPSFTYLPSSRQLLRARLSVTLGAVLPGPGYGAIEDGADPVSVLRDAIIEGRANEAGSARFDGRTVLRIDIKRPDHLPPNAPPLPADAPKIHFAQPYAYVEPKTFHPVELVWGGDAYRFLAYEYLPPKALNLALTNIRAQHPHAHVVIQVPRAR